MDASDPVSPLRAPHCPGRLAESASEGYQGSFGWRRLPLHQSQGPSAGAVGQCSTAHGHTCTPVDKRTQVHKRPHTRAQLCSTSHSGDLARLHPQAPKTTPCSLLCWTPGPPGHVYSWPCLPIRLSTPSRPPVLHGAPVPPGLPTTLPHPPAPRHGLQGQPRRTQPDPPRIHWAGLKPRF